MLLPVLALGLLSCAASKQPVAPHTESVKPEAAEVARPLGDFQPVFQSEAIPTDPKAYPYNHAASLAEMPNGDLLVAWAAGSAEAARDTRIVASRCAFGSSMWSPPSVIADTPDAGDANPVLFVDDTEQVRLFYVSLFGDTLCLSRIKVQTSSDSGATWSEPRQALEAACTLIRNKPIITPSGRWILPAYFQGIYQSRFYASDDRGESWRVSQSLLSLPNNLQPAVVVRDDGSLLALMRSADGAGFTWQGISTDDGATWQMSRRADLPNPGSGLDMTRLSSGEIALAYNPSTAMRTPLAVSFSDNDGQTWSPPQPIQEGEPGFAYPCILQTRDGTIHVVFSYRLQHIQHVEFNRVWLRGS